MKNKILAVILSITMAMSIMACGSDGSEKSEVKSSEKSEQSESTKQSESSAASEEAVAEEPVTITVEVYDRVDMTAEYGTPIDNKWANMMKEKALEEINVDLQYVAIPRSEDEAKIQTLLASGDAPDIFYAYGKTSFVNWAENACLADLTPYLETGAGKELADFLGEDFLEYGQIGGVQYAVNSKAYGTLGNRTCFVRKDLLEKVGVELGELNGHYAITPSKLMDGMTKIKEQGLCDYPIGMTSEDITRDAIIGAFISESAVTDEYLIQNVPYTYYLLDGTKEAFRYLNNCYNSGLINPDFPLFGQTELGEQIASGQVAFFAYTFYSLESYMDALHNAEEDAEIVAVELIHEDGSPAYYATATGVGAYCMVSNTCENVEAALKLIHWFMTSETAHLITQHGTEGEHFEVVDGVYTVIDAEYNKVDRVRCNDLNIALNSDPCWSDEAYLALSEKEVQNSYHAKTAQARIDGTALSWSEGKFQFPAVNTVIQASTDYAVELAENADNLINESIMTTVDKFDEVYDNYYEIYMNEGGSQYAEEALAFYNR